jgi:membrane protein DedA with SNARE-associated domain
MTPDSCLLLADADMLGWLEHAFYPVLLGVFVIASLGVPIPEDVPLIAAGVLLHTHPGIASWHGTYMVSMIGIMSGDLILYTLGKRWGTHVFEHRSVSWLITPARLRLTTRRFHRYGIWMVFFGRLVVGVRAVMCITAGVTRFPYWKFFLADFAGALLSIFVFIYLGYQFAHMLPTLQYYLGSVQSVLIALAAVAAAAIGLWEWRRHTARHRRKQRRAARLRRARHAPPAKGAAALPEA